MSELTQVRPLELIEAEIRFYAKQSADSMIEVGKRLIEAKEQVQHGEWGKWLEEKVEFSQDVANNFMKIAREFPNSAAVRNLSYRKILAIASVPSDQREEFFNENNLEEMTTRQVESKVKEWKDLANKKSEEARQLLEEKQKIEADLHTTNQLLKDTKADVKMLQEELRKKSDENKKELDRLQSVISDTKKQLAAAKDSGDSEEIDTLQEELEAMNAKVSTLNKEKAELEKQLKDKPIETAAVKTVEVIPEETKRELEELRKKAALPGTEATLKYKIHFEDLKECFRKLLVSLEEIKSVNPELYPKYRKATATLVTRIGEQVYDSVIEEAHQESAAASDCDNNCGICIHADMNKVADEDLDENKTFCTHDGQIHNFNDCCSYFHHHNQN